MHGIVDFHSHILPGIDDGSGSLEESLELMWLSARQGVQHMVATPHFYPRHDDPERFLRRREKAEQLLREELIYHPGLPEITVGAEVYFFSGISDSELINALTIGQKRCILIEMPDSPWTQSHYRELEGIYAKHGIMPVIAHVDRYIRPFRTYGIPERLEEMPVMVQANGSFFLHSNTQRMALRMLKQNRIHLLGSDCHNLTSRRPNLKAAVELIGKKLGADALDQICGNQSQLLQMQQVSL